MRDPSTESIPALLEQIRALLVAPATGDAAPVLTELEDTLTEGYARALALEAERWRLERQITEVASRLERSDASSHAELSALARGVSATGTELARLRELLVPLKARARAVRHGYATGG